ncbi:MAG: L-threonylcarbamoyladenylate synthase [Patescibacteria group bacterium]
MEILKINSKRIDGEKMKGLIDFIEKGKVMVFPTDTVYGLVADATNETAVEKVFKIKKRKSKTAVPIFIGSLSLAKKLAKISKGQERILNAIWPGPVTAVLARKKKKLYGVDKKTIALRIPNYRLVEEMLKRTKKPLTGTSANISGRLPLTEIKKVIASFEKQKYQPDLIVDAGNLPKSKPSTILDLTISPPKILRE